MSSWKWIVALWGGMCVASLGLVATASAVSLSPTSTLVTAHAGAVQFPTMGWDVDCSAVAMSFSTDDGDGTATDVTLDFTGCTAFGAAADIDCARGGSRTGTVAFFGPVTGGTTVESELVLDEAACVIDIWTGCRLTIPRAGTGEQALAASLDDRGAPAAHYTVFDGNALRYGVSSSFLCAGGNSTFEWHANGGGDVVFVESTATAIDVS